jgi:hypothetical protein
MTFLSEPMMLYAPAYQSSTTDISQSYWVFGPFPSSGDFGSKNTMFRKLDLFPSAAEEGRTHLLSCVPDTEVI